MTLEPVLEAPEDWPPTVTLFLSPPNFAMLRCTHFMRELLIQSAIIGEEMAFGIQSGMREPADKAKPIIDGDDDGLAVSGELARVVVVALAVDQSAAVDPEDNWKPQEPQRPSPNVQLGNCQHRLRLKCYTRLEIALNNPNRQGNRRESTPEAAHNHVHLFAMNDEKSPSLSRTLEIKGFSQGPMTITARSHSRYTGPLPTIADTKRFAMSGFRVERSMPP